MNATEQAEIIRYVNAVRTALADLPAPVREELLEDLADHLAEVAAEADGTLEERLGPPAAYAAELRATAGLAGSGRPGPQWATALDRAGRAARSADVRVGGMIGYERASDFLRLLRPGWWVLRGYLLAMVVLHAISPGEYGLLPWLDESAWIWFAVVAVGVVASVRLGKLTLRWRGRRAAVLTAGNLALALVVLAVAAGPGGAVMFTSPASVYESPYSPPRVYPYDRDGRPLPEVRLVDDYGNEVPIGGYYCEEGPVFAPPCVVRYPFPSIPPLPPATATVAPTPPAPSPSPSVTPSPTPRG